MAAVAAADVAAEATVTTAVAAATEAAAAMKGAGRGNIGSGGNSRESSLRSVEYLCFFLKQIHFLRSILRRPHTDRISEGVKKKLLLCPAEM